MLMTPITPKVMARPIAASSSTEPSETPYQTFCAAPQTARLDSMPAAASVAACCTGPGVPLAMLFRSERASRSPRAATMPTAAIFSSSDASERSTEAASACSRRARTAALSSSAAAAASAGIIAGSAALNIDSADVMRT